MMFSEDGPVRIDVLQRLAEQAMSDRTFPRRGARRLAGHALSKHGYDLTPQEFALVLRFRRSLADAGVDLDLVDGHDDDRLADCSRYASMLGAGTRSRA